MNGPSINVDNRKIKTKQKKNRSRKPFSMNADDVNKILISK